MWYGRKKATVEKGCPKVKTGGSPRDGEVE